MMDNMGIIVSETLLKEFRYEKKTTFKHVSSNYGARSCKIIDETDKKSGIGLFENNNESVSPFSVLTN